MTKHSRRLDKILKENGDDGWLYCLGTGRNEAGEILYIVCRGFEGRGLLTEEEIRAEAPEGVELIFTAIGVSDKNGKLRLDENGRPVVVDWQGI